METEECLEIETVGKDSLEEPVRALNLDLAEQEAFIRFFKTLPEKPATTIRIFSRDDYYTLHGDDAELVVSLPSFKSSMILKLMGEVNKLSYISLSRNKFEMLLRELLLVKQYRIEVYVKESPKGNKWKVEYKASPGNLSQFESVLFNNESSVIHTCMIAIYFSTESGTRRVGVCSVDENTRQFSLCEFIDNDLFSELEAVLVQIGPKECLLPKSESKDLKQIEAVLERNSILVTKLPQKDFSTDNLEQDLDRLLYFKKTEHASSVSLPEMSNKVAIHALSALIKYLDFMAIETNFHQYKLVTLNLNQFVHLDAAGVYSLNIIPKPGVNPLPENSILGLLNCCRTAPGRRLIMQWVKQPLRDINVINERLDIVEAFCNNSELRNALRDDYLRGIPDLQAITRKIIHKKASLQECFRIYQTVSRLPLILKELRREDNKSVQMALIDPLEDLLLDMDKYQQMIEQTIDMDSIERDEYLVKPEFDDTLRQVSEERDEIEEQMNKIATRACRELGIDSSKLKLESTAQHGFYLRVTLKDEQVLRKHKQYEIIDAIKGGVRFTIDELKSLNEEHTKNREIYEERQKDVVNEVLSIAGTYVSTITNLNYTIGKIDILVSFAHVAATASKPYVRPVMLPEGSGILDLKQVRHPCIEIQENISYIPNDCYFNKNENIFQIITGPNMGGKSTYLRSVGVTVLLAHIGSLVPCDEAKISLCDALLARIGAEDSEEKGLSTFMMEMVESAAVLRSATANSLVLIDELGRGTSTYEGSGIAWGIAEYLLDKKAFTLFATHFHELTRLADEKEHVVNRHVTALTDDDNFTLLYQIRDGACDQSYGIHLARMIGFPQEIIDEAIKTHIQLDPSVNMDPNIKPNEKRKCMQDAQVYIKDVLASLKQINLDSISDEELETIIRKLQSEGKTHSNPYLKSISSFDPEEYLRHLQKSETKSSENKFKSMNGSTNGEQKLNSDFNEAELLNGICMDDFEEDI